MSYCYRIVMIVFLLASNACHAMEETKSTESGKHSFSRLIQNWMKSFVVHKQFERAHILNSESKILNSIAREERILIFVADAQLRNDNDAINSQMDHEKRKDLDEKLCDPNHDLDYINKEELRVHNQQKALSKFRNQQAFDGAKYRILNCIEEESAKINAIKNTVLTLSRISEGDEGSDSW
ncbi:hypothetical protein KBC04_05070 [Candidatus Babeliales bacterium]|nr:hypothetical protein [Candidatus Babeliales bacterium]